VQSMCQILWLPQVLGIKMENRTTNIYIYLYKHIYICIIIYIYIIIKTYIYICVHAGVDWVWTCEKNWPKMVEYVWKYHILSTSRWLKTQTTSIFFRAASPRASTSRLKKWSGGVPGQSHGYLYIHIYIQLYRYIYIYILMYNYYGSQFSK
jgi:hypothetical protein